MAESIQNDSQGKVNCTITAALATGVPIQPDVLQVTRTHGNIWIDFCSATANIISRLAAAIAGKMQQLAFSFILNGTVETITTILEVCKLLAAITRHFSSLTITLTTLLHRLNSQPI